MLGKLRLILILLGVWAPTLYACPNLNSYYPGSSPNWSSVKEGLEVIFDQCLESSEYFALLGAAELNLRNLSRSIELLERSLLLRPDNGAALVDYGEALFRDGQLFSALEVNALATNREDVDEVLREQLFQRQKDWQSLTRQTSVRLDLGGGFDNNLNGAPDDSQIALTLSGEPIYLTLNEEFRSARGSFLNLGFSAQHKRVAPDIEQTFVGRARGRISDNKDSDISQVVGRYNRTFSLKRSTRHGIGAGLNHLLFSDTSLFTGTDAWYRYDYHRDGAGCEPYLGGAIQHQLWHTQRRLDGMEIKLGLGADCGFATNNAFDLSFEVNFLANKALNDNRLGGDREGLQLAGRWQRAIGPGELAVQVEAAMLTDATGYSVLLSNGARRRVERYSTLVQYRQSLQAIDFSGDIFINLFHQDQSSNINLFEISDSSIEVGISFNL